MMGYHTLLNSISNYPTITILHIVNNNKYSEYVVDIMIFVDYPRVVVLLAYL